MTINRKPEFADAQHGLVQRFWSHRLFHRMLRRQGVDPAAKLCPATEAMLFRGLDNCSRCKCKEVCRAWLAGNAPAANYVHFCPNSETIEALRIIAS